MALIIKSAGPLLGLVVALTNAPPCFAATIYCSGTLDAVYVTNDGQFVLRGTWRNDYTMICNLRQTWTGVAPETCAFWYAMMVTSKTNAKAVTLYYPNSSYTCATLPTYESAPAPGYVMQN
jgi:hypothetical protein